MDGAGRSSWHPQRQWSVCSAERGTRPPRTRARAEGQGQEREAGSLSAPWRSARSKPRTRLSRIIQVHVSSGCYRWNPLLPGKHASPGHSLKEHRLLAHRLGSAPATMSPSPRPLSHGHTALLSAPGAATTEGAGPASLWVQVPGPHPLVTLPRRTRTVPPSVTSIICATVALII